MFVLFASLALIATAALASPAVDRHRAAFMASMPADIVDKKITKEELTKILGNPTINEDLQDVAEEESCSDEEGREKREIRDEIQDEIRDETVIPIMSQPEIRPVQPILIGN